MKKILLTQGLSTWVDNDTHADLSKYKWYVGNVSKGDPTPKYYAMTKIDGKTTYIHRLIVGALKGQIVDHRDGDTLDNRRRNLRIVTPKQNCENRMPWRKR